MKKSNVLVIATVLIAVHLLVFFVFIGSKGDKPAEPRAVAVPQTTDSSADITIPAFDVPELKLLPESAAVAPVKVRSMPVSSPREVIAKPVNRQGYLRSDRTDRRTSKVYSNLTGDPYRSAIVVDARTGKILYEDHADAYAYPASVTKMMTMLIVLEQIKAGKISLNDKVAITKEVAGIGGSGVYLDTRESGAFTVENMLEALMIHSANDAATALAIHAGGSSSAFVDMMNRKARELGMNPTTYHTPHGLPLTAQPDISTAYDIAILSLAALRHPETTKLTGTKLSWLPTNQLRKEKFMLANRNVLVGKAPYVGCDGLKTGYHSKGGFSLAATAERNGQRVVAVLLGSSNRNTRNETARKLLDKGFAALAD
jgi:D-alanyl-D-alanine carboxypeptidase (penicillin-binding protein 5/6)